MDIKVEIENKFANALQEFRKSRGASYGMDRVVNKAMQYLVSFAVPKIPRADRARIRATYMAAVQRKKKTAPVAKKKYVKRERAADKSTQQPPPKKTARRTALVRSFAAFKVFRTNYKGARGLQGDAFYALVGKYVAARQFSAGYHRSGLIPALNTFRRVGGLQERIPRYKRLPGRARAADKNQIIPEAEVADAARAIAQIAPDAFTRSAPEVIKQLEKFTRENLNQRLKAAKLIA